MPIAVHAVPQAEFDAWLIEARTKFADNALPAETKIATSKTTAGAVMTLAETQH